MELRGQGPYKTPEEIISNNSKMYEKIAIEYHKI